MSYYGRNVGDLCNDEPRKGIWYVIWKDREYSKIRWALFLIPTVLIGVYVLARMSNNDTMIVARSDESAETSRTRIPYTLGNEGKKNTEVPQAVQNITPRSIDNEVQREAEAELDAEDVAHLKTLRVTETEYDWGKNETKILSQKYPTPALTAPEKTPQGVEEKKGAHFVHSDALQLNSPPRAFIAPSLRANLLEEKLKVVSMQDATPSTQIPLAKSLPDPQADNSRHQIKKLEEELQAKSRAIAILETKLKEATENPEVMYSNMNNIVRKSLHEKQK